MKSHMALEYERKPQLYLYLLVCILFDLIEFGESLPSSSPPTLPPPPPSMFVYFHALSLPGSGILIADSWLKWIKFLFRFWFWFQELSKFKNRIQIREENKIELRLVWQNQTKFMYRILMVFESIDANKQFIFLEYRVSCR